MSLGHDRHFLTFVARVAAYSTVFDYYYYCLFVCLCLFFVVGRGVAQRIQVL
jgi:hypothetical protein